MIYSKKEIKISPTTSKLVAKLAIKKQIRLEGQAKLSENLRASPFNNDPSNKTTFRVSLIISLDSACK
jgi:hypothetical protein